MTTSTAAGLRATLTDLINETAVAGISITGRYDSLTGPTVTPPAGTIRENGELVGIFQMPDGKEAATIDSWGSVASRCESLLAGSFRGQALADRIGYPLVVFLDEEGRVLTTSAELSHRQADATWRLARNELTDAGVDYEAIQHASRQEPEALVVGFPTAIPFGWWHSRTSATSKGAADKNKKSSGALADVRAEYLGHYVMKPALARSARLFTAELIAVGVHERRRRAAKGDSLFAAVSGEAKIGGGKLSDLGLGTLPPTSLDRSPSDLTFESIESRAFLSLTGLRHFRFTAPADSGPLTVALTLLLYVLLHEDLSLRAGTELALLEPLKVEIVRHGVEREPLDLPGVEVLADLVTELGAEAGWTGPRSITIAPDSPLGRVLLETDGAK